MKLNYWWCVSVILQCLGLCTGIPIHRKETGEGHTTDGDVEWWLCEEA